MGRLRTADRRDRAGSRAGRGCCRRVTRTPPRRAAPGPPAGARGHRGHRRPGPAPASPGQSGLRGVKVASIQCASTTWQPDDTRRRTPADGAGAAGHLPAADAERRAPAADLRPPPAALLRALVVPDGPRRPRRRTCARRTPTCRGWSTRRRRTAPSTCCTSRSTRAGTTWCTRSPSSTSTPWTVRSPSTSRLTGSAGYCLAQASSTIPAALFWSVPLSTTATIEPRAGPQADGHLLGRRRDAVESPTLVWSETSSPLDLMPLKNSSADRRCARPRGSRWHRRPAPP